IGCGAFGEFCMGAFSELEEVRPAAVADVRADAADRLAERFKVPAYYDPAELIAREDVDIVHIATPPASHHELVLAVARAGKNMLCEKPLAMNLDQADEMLAAAEQAGVIVPVNFILRYNLVADVVKAVIDSGVMGRVLSARLTNCASDGNLPPEHWFWNKELSGGIFIEHGGHFFDLYRRWLGGGEVIDAHTELREGTGQEDRVMCTVRHNSGAVVSHYHGFDQIGPTDRTDHRLVCELGDIRIEGWIPLSLTVFAATDDDGAARLAECCDGCDIEQLGPCGEGKPLLGRGKQRSVTKLIRLHYEPNSDKQTIYVESVRALFADQLAYIRDRSHVRKVTEQNGRDAIALAQAAATFAAARA
ncbi:MAG: Gfo/Idh/MocA family oxidoreductase, partial [Phycisphaerae bacterium]|nr:Gfo/Idh/MocA family oxidoreductase [Phycisphaerae bacterium]